MASLLLLAFGSANETSGSCSPRRRSRRPIQARRSKPKRQRCEGGRQEDEVSVEGADVEIKKVVLHWKNRKDETIRKVGVVKAGGQTAEKDAPGHQATLGR